MSLFCIKSYAIMLCFNFIEISMQKRNKQWNFNLGCIFIGTTSCLLLHLHVKLQKQHFMQPKISSNETWFFCMLTPSPLKACHNFNPSLNLFIFGGKYSWNVTLEWVNCKILTSNAVSVILMKLCNICLTFYHECI